MAYASLARVDYDYASQTAEEVTVHEEDIVYIMITADNEVQEQEEDE